MNEQKIALLTDSCADIPQADIEKYDIYVVPLRLLFSDGEFADGVDITASEVYQRLRSEIPKTTLPSGEWVENTFARIRAAGYTRVIALNFSSGLSGTYNMIRLMGEQQEGLQVAAFDTMSGSLGTGMTVLQVARWLADGWEWEALMQAIPILIQNTRVYFCINTLEYLQKGGRIGKTAAIAGTLLQIKPIMGFTDEGELTDVAKVRGRKAAIEKMVHMLTEIVPQGARYNLAVAHGDTWDELVEIRKILQNELPDFEHCAEGEIDCTLAAYVGPKLIGAAVQILPDKLFALRGGK